MKHPFKSLVMMFLIGSVIVGAATFAADVTPVMSIDEACQDLTSPHPVSTSRPGSFSFLMKWTFDRGAFISPRVVEAGPEVSGSGDGPIAVFTLGQDRRNIDGDSAKLERLNQDSQKQGQIINVLKKSSSPAECVSKATQLGWSPADLEALQDEQDSALPTIRRKEAAVTFATAQGVVSKHPGWQTVPVDSWSEILEFVRTHAVSGILMMVHADPNGRLYDSERNEIPDGFFSAIPDSIRIVGLYSCESTSVMKAYSLDKLSSHEIVTVKLGSPFDRTETTPVALFPQWEKKLEKDFGLDHEPTAALPEDRCQASIEGLRLSGGKVSLTLGTMPVGIWSGGDVTSPVEIPCDWIESSKNSVAVIQPTQIKEKIQLESENFSIVLAHGAQRISSSTPTIFRWDDGSFRSAQMEF